MAPTTQIAVRISDELLEALERAATDDDRSRAYIVQKALEAWLTERGYIETAKATKPKRAAGERR
jgi:predicted transcriptional regulator